jgi:hypothetical protein
MGVALGVGEGDGLGVGRNDGVGLGVGRGVGEGVGVAPNGVGLAEGVAVGVGNCAAAAPDRAEAMIESNKIRMRIPGRFD